MKFNRIIVCILVFLMLFINATSIFAEESVEYKINTIDTTEQNSIGDDVSSNSIGDIDPSEIMAQSKPAGNTYDDDEEGRIFQTDNFAPMNAKAVDNDITNITNIKPEILSYL